MKLIPRADYMAGKVTHRQYYAQFVTPYVTQAVLRAIGRDTIIKSTNEHFNDIQLYRWDAIIGWSDFGRVPVALNLGCGKMLRECGDSVSASTLICIMKEAAQQIKEAHGKAAA